MNKKIYGYVRVSTMKQKTDRQAANIRAAYPQAVIVSEKYTGTTLARPQFKKLMASVQEGDTIVFDEVSRMARNAEEGYQAYKALFKRGVNLVFLKERHLDTANFKDVQQIAMTGTEVDCILEGVNKYLLLLAERQIEIAFETAQKEVDYLHQRISEGIAQAKLQGKPIGRSKGSKVVTKKAIACKEKISQHSKTFGGTLTDKDVIKLLGITRNTYYKYKKELLIEQMEDNEC